MFTAIKSVSPGLPPIGEVNLDASTNMHIL